MIELTQLDPYAHRIESWKVRVMLDQITHFHEAQDRGRTFSEVHLVNGKILFVYEDVFTIESRIREYAEIAQRERIVAIVQREMEKYRDQLAQDAEVQRSKWRDDLDAFWKQYGKGK